MAVPKTASHRAPVQQKSADGVGALQSGYAARETLQTVETPSPLFNFIASGAKLGGTPILHSVFQDDSEEATEGLPDPRAIASQLCA